jgi:hypothetical protein
MVPGDYKRKYRFKSDTSKEQKYIRIAIWVSVVLIIALAVLLYRPFGR